mgnify:FL=1|tara:strand:+ start:306 stop:941 length:636 start_codon:yes stop_codon:yes gene_type:complete
MPEPIYLTAGLPGDSTSAAFAAQQGYLVKFTHQPTGHIVEFPAIISDFSDSHQPAVEKRYGSSQHDPITTMTKTGRNISFTLSVLNSSIAEARHNTQCVNLLIQMLYPLMDNRNAFNGDPFINIHMMNLLDGNSNGDGVDCVIESLDYNIDFDNGVINDDEGISGLNLSGKEIYPISMNLTIGGRTTIQVSSDSESPSPIDSNYPSYLGGR